MGSPMPCPHKAVLPSDGFKKQEKVCKDCLATTQIRLVARDLVRDIQATGLRCAEYALRAMSYLEDPEGFPLYEQEYVDTSTRKVVRAANMTFEGAKFLTPVLALPYAIGVQAAHAAWNYGQYGLLGLFFSNEIAESMRTLLSMSAVLQAIEPREMIVGLLYLSARQRNTFGSFPEGAHEEAMQAGAPVPNGLLDLLLALAGVGMHAPYEDNAFEVQRLALQQQFRLVAERLGESRKHRPAWCLYLHEEQHLAVLAIRGTDLEKSLGGDLFTDVNAMPECAEGLDDAKLWAHSGMLASARALLVELRPSVVSLLRRGLQVVLVGHSLGAGVASLMTWLLHFGMVGERLPDDVRTSASVYGVGYATPSCMDRSAADAMRPFFTSVVNPVDLVPRLSISSLQELANDIVACARESMSDLDDDVQAYVDRISSVWAPRLRRRASQVQPSESDAAEEEIPHVKALLTALSRRATSVFTADSLATARPASIAGEEANSEEADGSPSLLMETQILTCGEDSTLWIPGGPESIILSWYGDAKRPWQSNNKAGAEVTEKVIKSLTGKGTITVNKQTLGDPCPWKTKVLMVLVKMDKGKELFCPGIVVCIYRRSGRLEAATVPCDLPSLRRVICDKRMVADHGRFAYQEALRSVRAGRASPRNQKWQPFTEAGELCPCCHSVFDWMSTARSRKQRPLSMTNCRACGLVVCVACASTKQARPELGLFNTARICDRCAWGCGSAEDGAALRGLQQAFNSVASRRRITAVAGALRTS
eukprot:TRINITY_DN45020_c0_g1_i1.p1 TRINITY_DN45020_c0_g1~~TRINITY_DN45020_c0_g1_i1.p1  ORF type:complete len:801 (+),score=111.17 TRINITY_DN45020_c0_g1_i1:110-2404(+)